MAFLAGSIFFLGLPQRDSLIFFHSLFPEIHRYDASIEYDVFFRRHLLTCLLLSACCFITSRGGTELFKIAFFGKVKVLRRNKSPVFFRFPPDGFPPPAHLANFVAKWPSPPAPVIPTLENQYWFPSFSPHHYRFVSSLPRSP